jgi:two-component system OmpR family sensor kinase
VRRLYSRIYVHFLAVLLVVGLATSLVFALGARGVPLQEVAERLARHVASLVAERLDDPDALAARVQQLHADLEIDLTVRDLSGRLLSRAGAALPELTDGEAAEVRAGRVVVRPRPAWLAAAPIRDPVSGAVVAVLEASARRHVRWPALLRPGLLVVLVLGIVAVATAPLARRISRPVERLTEAARRLGGGDLAHRVPLAEPRRRWVGWRRRHAGVDELQALTRAFNDMADRIDGLLRGQQELLVNVSHELRSPLARIRVALELLPRTAETETRLADLERDLSELDRLIEAVLTTSRLEAAGLTPHPAPVDVGRLLAEVAERAAHDPMVAGRSVRVAEGPAFEMVADGALLKRALWNLVENAAKYGAPPITLAAKRQGDRVTLSVTDEGSGIPPAERGRVLTPFYRLDRARTPRAPDGPPRGFGLGLTLARRVAEVHHGTIAIGPAATEDGRERGCRVAITIPQDAATAGPGRGPRPSARR